MPQDVERSELCFTEQAQQLVRGGCLLSLAQIAQNMQVLLETPMPRVKAKLKPWLRLYACSGVESRLFVLEGTALPVDGVLRHPGYRILFATEVVSVLRQADGDHLTQLHLSALVGSDIPLATGSTLAPATLLIPGSMLKLGKDLGTTRMRITHIRDSVKGESMNVWRAMPFCTSQSLEWNYMCTPLDVDFATQNKSALLRSVSLNPSLRIR